MKTTVTTEKWATGMRKVRTFGPDENIYGATLQITLDNRWGTGVIIQLFDKHYYKSVSFQETKLDDLRAYLEIEGITSPYYAERIAEIIKTDIEKLTR